MNAKEIEKHALQNGWHSEEFVVMFLGYLTAEIPELHRTPPPQLLVTWDKFKAAMGKQLQELK